MPNIHYDVIVIGAGIAGITAAKTLAERGYTILVLEAKNRVGGRIHSIKTTSHYPIEVGAMILQEPGTPQHPNPLTLLLKNNQIRTQNIDIDNSEAFDATGVPLALNRLPELAMDEFNRVNMLIQEAKCIHWSKPPSLAEVLMFHRDNLPKPGSLEFMVRQTVTATIEHQTGGALADISINELKIPNSEYAMGSKFVNEGFQPLITHLLEDMMKTQRVTLRLDSPVKEIYHDIEENKAHITLKNHQKYFADSILRTIPVGVLKAEHIKFSPKLSAKKQKAINHTGIGLQNKVILEFEKPFWDEFVHFIFPGSQDCETWPEYLNLFHFSNQRSPTLVANYYAQGANFKNMTNDAIIHQTLLPLQKIYGKKISALRSAFITHWDTDPYAIGSTSFCGLDLKLAEREALATPEPGGLFFAGAHTITNSSGETVEKAYRSALQATLDIDLFLKMKNEERIKFRSSLRPKK
jgi:monoamine oxidase